MAKKCGNHRSYAHCTECGAEYNIPTGFVLIPEEDVVKLNEMTELGMFDRDAKRAG